jgi:hypothetical protein
MPRFAKHNKSDNAQEGPKSGPVVVTTRFNQNPLWQLRFKLISIIVICLVILLGAIWGGVKIWRATHHQAIPVATNKAVSQEVVEVPPLTAEQKHEMTAVVRADASVVALSGKSITVKLTNGTTLVLSTSKDTLYSSGNKGYPAERGDVKPGQDAIVLYDTEQLSLKSIWVAYDQQQ